MDYSKFKYYKGEEECPFNHDENSDNYFGMNPLAFWWEREREMFERVAQSPRLDQWDVRRAIKCWIWKADNSYESQLEKSYESGKAPVIP